MSHDMSHDRNALAGRIRVSPPLAAAEREHLSALAASIGTLRGTVTGRGADDVPFARLCWVVCGRGCCLTWHPGRGAPAMMLPTLSFLVHHLLGAGARAEGRPGFDGFTFDHVLDGLVVGGGRLVEVRANTVHERVLDEPCERPSPRRETRPRPLPANVVELRPRRA